MAPALSQPLLLFCQAILLGMAAALLYDLLRPSACGCPA